MGKKIVGTLIPNCMEPFLKDVIVGKVKSNIAGSAKDTVSLKLCYDLCGSDRGASVV